MATKRKPRSSPANNAGRPGAPPPPADGVNYYIPEDEDEENILEITRQFGPGDVMVKVYRQDSGVRSYCGYFTNAADVNEESVKALGFGPGKYVLHILLNNEYQKAVHMAIAAQTTTTAIQPTNGADTPMVKMLMDQINRLELRLSQPQQEREPLSAIISGLAQMQGMLAGGNREMPIDALMKAIELGKQIAGGKGPEDDSFGGILKDILKESAPALATAFLSRGQPAAAPAAPAPAAITEASEVTLLEAQLKAGLIYLKKKCIGGSDPELYLEWILENATEPPYAQLIHAAVNQEFSAFAKLDAEIEQEPFQKFFLTIYNGIRSAFNASDSVDTDPGRQGGNNGNAGGNGSAGKASGG